MEFQSRDLKKQSNKHNVYYRYMDLVRITYKAYEFIHNYSNFPCE